MHRHLHPPALLCGLYLSTIVRPLAAQEAPAKPADPTKVRVALDGTTLTIHGARITLPCKRAELVKVLGKPSRETKLSNVLLTWDEHGLVAYQDPDSDKVHAFAVALAPGRYSFSPKKAFRGGLTVDGATVTAQSTADAINKAKTGQPFAKDKVLTDTWSIRHDKTLITLAEGKPGDKEKFIEFQVSTDRK